MVTAEGDRRRGDGCRGAEMRRVRDGPGDVLRRRVHLARWRALGIAHVVDRMDGDFNGRKSQRKGKNQDAGPPPAPRAEEDGAEHGQKEESVTACGWGPRIADRVNRPQDREGAPEVQRQNPPETTAGRGVARADARGLAQARVAARAENLRRGLPGTLGRIYGHCVRTSSPALRPGAQTKGSGRASGATPGRSSARSDPGEKDRATPRSPSKGLTLFRGARCPSSAPDGFSERPRPPSERMPWQGRHRGTDLSLPSPP